MGDFGKGYCYLCADAKMKPCVSFADDCTFFDICLDHLIGLCQGLGEYAGRPVVAYIIGEGT